ncbi:MAG: NAD(+) synthase [Victivallaceae bacterium]|nr:NAD(+) synthase [Victivallaceae bacterium]MDD5664448.1 NAD(+) synthase [Victivallaceae bacterium]
MFGFYRIAAAVPVLKVGAVAYNTAQILDLYEQASEHDAAAVVFPELSVTGYSCGDLFFQERLLNAAREGAIRLAKRSSRTLMIFGMPLSFRDAIYNVAVIAQNGSIRGIVPKTLLPNYREFYEKRHFTSGMELKKESVALGSERIPFGSDLIFEFGDEFSFAVEICEDLWGIIPPSSLLALGGAKIIFNLSAGTGLAGKSEYRRELVKQQSARCLAAYAMASAGVHESTTDCVFSGHSIIAENGRLAAENKRFSRQSNIIFADIDLHRLRAARRSDSSFNDCTLANADLRRLELDNVPVPPNLEFAYLPATPFVPEDDGQRAERCREIINIQCAALAKRIEHTKVEKLVIGVSGGLDSSLALLAAAETCKLLKRPSSDIIAVTMPGFGTSGRTYQNALKLCSLLKTTKLEIDIKPGCLQHFSDIGHDPELIDTTYENVQARERTRILMNLANKHCALVLGTGDLSEIALGWSTFNGDHMSMYSINCSVPKTLIRFLIAEIAADVEPELAAVLRDIANTPVSPELLPPASDGTIQQDTESLVGPYELHDFFLWHFIKYGAEPAKLKYLAAHAFDQKYDLTTIDHWLKVFLTRFFQQQFKRSCMPDGPKIGSIALSPRADWRMPSDAVSVEWMTFQDLL